jgi:hypothetical protein
MTNNKTTAHTSLTSKIWALSVVADLEGHDLRDMTSKGYTWTGLTGGGLHVVFWTSLWWNDTARCWWVSGRHRQRRHRTYHVDLVLEKATLHSEVLGKDWR